MEEKMAENNETRSKTSHRTHGQVTRQVKGYNHTPEQRQKRTDLTKNRREFIKEGRVAVGDHKDIDHKIPYSRGGSNAKTNLHVMTASANRRKGTKTK
jgi:5-methylcytosine-specific restriction endonuclease McrA